MNIDQWHMIPLFNRETSSVTILEIEMHRNQSIRKSYLLYMEWLCTVLLCYVQGHLWKLWITEMKIRDSKYDRQEKKTTGKIEIARFRLPAAVILECLMFKVTTISQRRFLLYFSIWLFKPQIKIQYQCKLMKTDVNWKDDFVNQNKKCRLMRNQPPHSRSRLICPFQVSISI